MKRSPSAAWKDLPAGVLSTFVLLFLQHQMYQVLLTKTRSLEQFNFTSATVDSPPKPVETFPFHPFKEDEPKFVVILSYQRSGSSYVGDLLGKNEQVFYLFEPLDGFYSALYGTEQGLNVPSDITNHRDGSIRMVPSNELSGVSEFLRALLMCEVDSLPTESISHRFLFNDFYQNDVNHVRCIREPIIQNATRRCWGLAPIGFCGQRFGQKSEERVKECNLMLNDASYRKQRPDLTPIFRDYLICRKRLRMLINLKCMDVLRRSCSGKSLRAMKVVRATMQSMEPLLENLPNFRLIHLMRDPRAVLISRTTFDSSGMGAFTLLGGSKNYLLSEAKLYCSAVVRDLQARKVLEKKYPGKIYPLLYEDVVKDLKSYTEKIYAFLNFTSPVGKDWWGELYGSQSVDKSLSIANKWHQSITYYQNKEIINICRELFDGNFSQRWSPR